MRRALLRLGLLAALVCVLTALTLKHVFVIRKISVSGNDGIPAETVISASGLEPGQSMFRLNTETVRNGISGLGTHAYVDMQRGWPDQVHIEVRPRVKAAMALCTGGMAILDGELIVMDVLPEAPECDLVYLSGPDIRGVSIGRQLQMEDGQAEISAKLLAAIFNSGAESYISEIHLYDEEAVLVLRGGCSVILNTGGDLHAQMTWLKLLAQDLERRGERGGTLQISREGCADYVPSAE